MMSERSRVAWAAGMRPPWGRLVAVPSPRGATLCVVASAQRDVQRQKSLDRNFQAHQDVLVARMGAVVAAQRAYAARETGSAWALRQSLIDLAAIAELLADGLPPPSV